MDALRPYLLPLTRSLPYPLPSLGTTLLGPTCYTTLIHDLDLTHTPCLRLALSKTLGLGIVLTSSVVKIPQLLKLRASRSSAGISPLACALETAAYLITLAYSARSGFPFTTYGETALIAVQNVVVTVLVLRYQGRQAAAGMFVAGVVLGGGCLWEGRVVGEGVLRGLQAGAGVLAAASKAPQIWEVWRNGGTGQLSAFAVGTWGGWISLSLPALCLALCGVGERRAGHDYGRVC